MSSALAGATFSPMPGVSIHLFGRKGDWRLSPQSLQSIGVTACALGAKALYAPRPATPFNGVVRSKKEFNLENMYGNGVRLYRCADTDGVRLKPGDAFFFASGDCPTLVLFNPVNRRLVCAHAGRDCLWDRKRVVDGEKPRTHASVVMAAIESCTWGDRSIIGKLTAFVTCGIAGRNFDHRVDAATEMAKSNLKMVQHFQTFGECLVGTRPNDGRLSLRRVIFNQLVTGGVDPDRISWDTIDTYGDTDTLGEYVWWSHKRWFDGGKMGECGRNGVFVVYRG